MHSIKRVGGVVQDVYGADALTIACQVQLNFFFEHRVCPVFLMTLLDIRMGKQRVNQFPTSISIFFLESLKGTPLQVKMTTYILPWNEMKLPYLWNVRR